MTGLPRGSVRLVPHREEWTDAAESEIERLRAALGDRAVALEHVGSTAIEGLAAKPILDLLVAVENPGDPDEWTATLQALDYEFRPNDPVPDRHFFAKGPEDERTHYLSITAAGSDTHVEQVQFRDYLRANPDAAEEYERLKRDLAERFPEDRASYTERKSAFVERVLEVARGE